MKCLQCGFENDLDAEFCERCGTALVKACPKCGNPLKPGALFCKKCGTRLVPQQTPPEKSTTSIQETIETPPPQAKKIKAMPAEVEGERKLVTILFTDIVGSTSLAEKLDPEEWKEIVAGAHQRVSQAVYRYDGTIAQLLGDGVLAFFGAPVTHEDDPLRAVRCALDIQESLQEYRHKLAKVVDDFQMRIGIHSGMVVTGPVGDDRHMEYLAVGDAVNLAARLQSAAQPGKVLISQVVADQVRKAFDLQSLGEISVKGKSDPVSVFEVLAGKPNPESLRGFEKLHSPLVGRDQELARILKALESLISGHGQIIAILGEAGIGKSRLVEEACHARLDGGEALHWVEGRALSYGQSLPFWTITQLLFNDLGLSDGDPEVRIRAAVRKRVNELFGGEASAILPYLLHLTGVQLEGEQAERINALDGETLKHQIILSVGRYFERLAQANPTIVVFEDLHWIDNSSLEALEQIMPITDRAPLALILVSRLERDLPSWQIKQKAEAEFPHRYTEIQLQPLLSSDQNQLVDNLLALAELPASVRQLILERSEGNPFYLEEIIRSLIDQGALVHEGDSWKVNGELQDLSIPTTLQGVLLARIDRLNEDVRHTLQLASVIGKSFLYRLLAVIAEAEQQLDQHLAFLQRADLIREKNRKPELEYIFKHSLTQEAAYNSLLVERRRLFHQQVGVALENLFSDRQEQFLGLLAYHFEAAGDPGKAIDYLIRAGDQARLSDEHAEAIDDYRRALKLLEGLTEDGRAAQVWLKLALIYHANFQFTDSHQAYEAAFQLQKNIQKDKPDRTEEGLQTLRVLCNGPFVDLDPGKENWGQDGEVILCLFSGLARIDGELNVIPEIARSWQVLDNGRRYLFRLRDDFKWSDGTPVTANDFEWAWKRNLDPATKSSTAPLLFDISGARDYHSGNDPNPARVGIRALDEHTLEVRLVEAVAYFPFIVTLPVAFPLPHWAIEQYGADWWQTGRMVTNGPFRLVSIDLQQECIAERSQYYPDRASGNIGRIQWAVLQDQEKIMQAFLGNHTDFIRVLKTLIHTDLPKGEVQTSQLLFVLFLLFNPDAEPTRDLRVRKALGHAIDRRSLAEFFESMPSSGGLVPPGMPGHSPEIGLGYDLEQAQRLLAEAGFPGGKGFPSLTALTYHGLIPTLGKELTRQWREHLDIEVNFKGVNPLEMGDWAEKRLSGEMTVGGWLADYPDPDNFLRHSTVPSSLNSLGWRNTEYDRLVEGAASTRDRGKRMAMYRRADNILVQEQALVIPLTHGYSELNFLVKPWVRNLKVSALGNVFYQDLIINRESRENAVSPQAQAKAE